MQPLPDTSGVPLVQAPPAGGAGHPEQGRGQPVPADTGGQYEKDALQRGPVVSTSTTWEPEPPRSHWDQGLQPPPELLSQYTVGHRSSLNDMPHLPTDMKSAHSELISKRRRWNQFLPIAESDASELAA
ncbi:hypothetical protein Cs7R123_47780 [Catellatospora sp. TT07R-123]|nr:hypothetical protein Cs7R123_47780 [Catellatospora sp. TT07R-123]